MKRTHWMRLALCGFVAGVIWHLLSVTFLATVAPDFFASVQRSAPHPAQGGAFFFAIDVLMGVWAVWLYSAMAPRYGGKLTTVATAGVAWWILKTLQSAKWAGLGFVALGPSLIPLGVATLGATVLALAAGGWLYTRVGADRHMISRRRREATTPRVQPVALAAASNRHSECNAGDHDRRDRRALLTS